MLVVLKREGSRGTLPIPEGRVQREWSHVVLSGGQRQDQGQCSQTETQEFPSERQERLFHCDGAWALAQVAQGGYGVSIHGDTEKPSGDGCGKLAVGAPGWAEGWTRWPPEVPPNLRHSVIPWLEVASFPTKLQNQLARNLVIWSACFNRWRQWSFGPC